MSSRAVSFFQSFDRRAIIRDVTIISIAPPYEAKVIDIKSRLCATVGTNMAFKFETAAFTKARFITDSAIKILTGRILLA